MRPLAHRLDDALDPRQMGPRLAAVLGGAATCHVLDAKCEPGVRTTVLYDLAGRLVRGDLLDPSAKPTLDLAGAGHVVELGLYVRVFPDDPDLPALPLVTDPAHLGPVLARLQQASASRSTTRCRIRLLRYRPGKRATVLARATPSVPAVVAKVYHNQRKAAAVAAEAPGLAALTTRNGVLRFAPPAGLLAEWNVVVQESVHGTALDALLSGGAAHRRAVDGVLLAARALAELHEFPALSRRNRPVEKELHRFGERARRVAPLDPDFAAGAMRLADRLLDRHDRLPPARLGLVHGDCKPSQFLVSDTHVHLLDLDHCGISDQATDVGTFLATLRQHAVRRDLALGSRGTTAGLERLEQDFLDSYVACRSGEVDAVTGRTRWQQTVALERKAMRAFARAPRSPLAPALLKEANRCLEAWERAA
jgi:aminoglycoside phosphotransferase (APT) family kinase protein